MEKKFITKILSVCEEAALYALLPKTCLHCKADLAFGRQSPLCPDCEAALEPVPELFCRVCGVPLPNGGAHCRRCRPLAARNRKCRLIRSAFVFNGVMRSLVHGIKYKGRKTAALWLGAGTARAFARYPELSGCDLLVPVPLSRERLAERGYNQSALLAGEICAAVKLELSEPALEKIKNTPAQVALGKNERLKNLAGAFAAEPALVKGKKIILIDDVATTGATFESCADALKKAGAACILGFSAAREE